MSKSALERLHKKERDLSDPRWSQLPKANQKMHEKMAKVN